MRIPFLSGRQQMQRQFRLVLLLLFASFAPACSDSGNNSAELEQTTTELSRPTMQSDALQLVQQWVYGNYNNVAQAEADMAADLPPEKMHRPMHQLFARVEAPNISGYILYQQSSMDGSENPAMIFRHGLMQYFVDPDTGVLHQRELYFNDIASFKNAHRNPEILRDVTLDDMTWDAGCDFYLQASDDGQMVSGPLLDGKCIMFNQGLQKNMVADDKVEITATDYAFRGRFRDEDGNILWGTESEELNRMVRQEP